MADQVNYTGKGGRDSQNYHAPWHIVGARFRHSGNRFVYTVSAIAWDSERDLWVVHYTRGANSFVRTVANFMGNRHDTQRFTFVSTADAAGDSKGNGSSPES